MRLEVSRKADLATRALLELARSKRRWKAAELGARIGTTPGFLSQVLTPLVQAGWVRSEPGPTGGYTAATDLDTINVLEVIEAVEGPSEGERCVLDDEPCSGERPCALHVPWTRARGQLVAELRRTPLASLTPRHGPEPPPRSGTH